MFLVPETSPSKKKDKDKDKDKDASDTSPKKDEIDLDDGIVYILCIIY